MALNVYLRLKINGSDIEGDTTLAELEGFIECLSYQAGVASPVDKTTGTSRIPSRSGRTAGRHQHDPIVFWKRINKSSPILLKALCRGEQVNSAEFRFYRPDPIGREEHFYTVLIENGYISSVQQISESEVVGGHMNFPVEEVEITFAKITWTSETDGMSFTDGDR